MIKLSIFRQSAFASLGLTVLVILLALLGSLFLYLTYTQVRAYNNSLEVTSGLTAQSVIEKVDRNFYERFGDVQAFAFNRLAVETAKADSLMPGLQDFINTMTAYYVLYDLMMVVDRNGNAIAVNTKDKNGNTIPTGELQRRNYANEEWFRACMDPKGPAGGAWYSDFVVNAAVGRVYGGTGAGMAFAAPIRDVDGSILGAWYNFASWKEVTEGIREEAEKNLQQDHPGAFMIMTDNRGNIISAADASMLDHTVRVDTSDHTVTTELAQLKENLIFGSAQGKGAYTFAGKNWTAITFVPSQSMSWGMFFSRQNIWTVAISLAMVTLICLYIFRDFRKSVISRIRDIGQLQERLGEGEILEVHTEDEKDDEFGRMKKSLGSLAETLKQKSSFADEISKGNLDAELKSLSKNDVLGHSLINMRNQLRVSRQNDNQRNWAAEGLAQISQIMRSSKTLEELCHDIIKFVVTYSGSNQGGLFLITEEDDSKVLKLTSCYAYEKRRFHEKTLDIHQGLVGQCIAERSTIYLKVIPPEYIVITSGLGGASPKSLLIVPLKTNDEIYGALELASFREYQPHEITLVEKLAETIGASIAAISTGDKTKTLLAQMQQQTEEMKAQEEEMRQNMEELSATQEEMLRKEREYLQRIKALENEKQVV